MRIRSKNKEGQSQWLNGALAGALFVIVLSIIPNVFDWLRANLLTADPMQGFVGWGTAERAFHYTAFEIIYSMVMAFLLLVILLAVILFAAYGQRR